MWGWPTGRTGWSRPRARSWASRPPSALAADGGGGDAPGPSLRGELDAAVDGDRDHRRRGPRLRALPGAGVRSEEHTSELQSRGHLVCRLLLEKKKKKLEN